MSSAAEFEGPLSRIADKGVSHNGVIHMAGHMIGCRKLRAYKDVGNLVPIRAIVVDSRQRRESQWRDSYGGSHDWL